MPSIVPDGQPAPQDGALPPTALAEIGRRGFGAYVHIPFCARRCGYCDFNTYAESDGVASPPAYVAAVLAEIDLAGRVLQGRAPRLDTVYLGGGTPTLLDPDQLARILAALEHTFGLAAGAEVTVEANPESVDPARLRRLRAAGFTRISLGMQSVAPHVLALLDRRHSPGRAAAAAVEARAAGFDHVNLDLIYATPGETAADFAASLQAATATGADHVSAYSLIVEEGTRLAARVRRGEVPPVDDDVAADRYLAADAALGARGFAWYEVSNWARPGGECRHNLLYWRSGDWWGFGAGAHSHIGGVRWWNVRHPASYLRRLESRPGAPARSPAQAREVLTESDRRTEQIMLELRLASGLALADLEPSQRAAAAEALGDGLLDPDWFARERAVLTRPGRLLADRVILNLIGAQDRPGRPGGRDQLSRWDAAPK